MKTLKPIALFLTVFLLLTVDAFARHPLVTDDTGTQGSAGGLQLELKGEISRDEEQEEGVVRKTKGKKAGANLSIGVAKNADVILDLPYIWSEMMENDILTSDIEGLGDIILELKWMSTTEEGLSLAFKPALILPTGDEEKGLGNGELSYAITLIITERREKTAYHLNLGYTYNMYKLQSDEDTKRNDIWRVSFAGEGKITEGLTLVGDIGMERNLNKTSNNHPAFILGGIIYCLSKNLDIDLALKAGLTEPEVDYTGLFGITLRF